MIRKLSLLFFDCALIALAVLGALLCLCSAFELALPREAVLLVLLATPLFCALFRLKKGWIAALAALGLMAFAVYSLLEELGYSFVRLAQLLMDRYVKGYGWLSDYYPQLDPGVVTDAAAALTSVALLQSYLLSLSLSRWKRTLPGAASLLLTVLPCFVLLDTPPDVAPLLLMSFAVLVMVFTQGVRRRAEEEMTVAVGITALGTGLLLALLLWLFPFEKYQPPVRWETISNELDRIGVQLDNRSNVSAGLDGDSRSVSLKQLSRLPDRPATVLQIRSDRSGLLYLRGVAFAGFDGSSWKVDATVRWSRERLFPALGMNANAHYTIQTDRIESVIFTPYELTSLPDGSETVSDAYLGNAGKLKEYNLSVAQNVSGFESGSEEAETYLEWLDEVCLSVPETTREYLLDWWRENGIPGRLGTDYSAQDVAARISYVSDYNRTPEHCPSDRDFCDWFLNDAAAGYCVHYATCLTAMLRALGVPARYVSGYVVETAAGEFAEVSSMNAHAWTEYYQDGCWHLVDATPRNATEFTGIVPSASAEPVYTDNVPMEPTRSHDRPGGGSETTEATLPAAPTETPETTLPQSPEGGQPEKQGEGPALWLWALLAAVLLLVLLVLRRRIKRSLRRRRYAAASMNGKAVLLWKRYQRLCRCLRLTPEASWSEVAYKAAFSQHLITQEELEPLRQEVVRQERILYWTGLVKRLYFCYIVAVI